MADDAAVAREKYVTVVGGSLRQVFRIWPVKAILHQFFAQRIVLNIRN